jgi:magnesium-transporting ATPase (P-type)
VDNSARALARGVPGSRTPGPWHSLDLDTVAQTLGTSLRTGLRREEAARRLTEFGPNELEVTQGVSAWSLLLEQLKNVLVLMLLVAVALSAALGHATEAVVIVPVLEAAKWLVRRGWVAELKPA